MDDKVAEAFAAIESVARDLDLSDRDAEQFYNEVGNACYVRSREHGERDRG
jgi:hypothetical protein